MLLRAALVFCVLADFAAAEAPQTSTRPKARPTGSSEAAAIALAVDQAMVAAGVVATPIPARPVSRPPICGFADVEGERISRITGTLRGCGVTAPVRVTSVSGYPLSQPAVMNCRTVAAFRNWVAEGMAPAIGRLGGGVSRIEVAAHYSCRSRNHRRGAPISEHGKGNAIDISGFALKNGGKVTVLQGWQDRDHGRRLRKMHRAACGPFGTVLGPDSDRFHRDHFHFDTARHGGSAYCR